MLTDGCPNQFPADVFFQCGKFKAFVRTDRNAVLKTLGYLASRNEFFGTPGQSSLKPIKLGQMASIAWNPIGEGKYFCIFLVLPYAGRGLILDTSPSKKPQDVLTLLIVRKDISECVID